MFAARPPGRRCYTQSCPRRRLLAVECAIQSYPWGVVGTDSLVARLGSVSQVGMRPDEAKHYAELWIGAHPNGPAMVSDEHSRRMPMGEWNERRYHKMSAPYGKPALPYLFKVLSVRSALSIQAHPDRRLARQLHARDPKNYRDPNHKPELACAVTQFEALCSFKPAPELLRDLRACPELVSLIGAPAVDAFAAAVSADPAGTGPDARASLRSAYTLLMRSDDEEVREALRALLGRLSDGVLSPSEALALRLHQQYPGDVGVFCAFLLNHRVLAPGEAIFLAANEPHAYIVGDCIECMACSDNVIRAGLTPKFKDVSVLCDSLTYSMGPPCVLPPLSESSAPELGTVYRPPTTEFQLRRLVASRGGRAKLAPSPSVGTLLVCEGSGTAIDSTGHRYVLRPGATALVLPDTEIEISAKSDLVVFCCQEQAGRDRPAERLRAGA